MKLCESGKNFIGKTGRTKTIVTISDWMLLEWNTMRSKGRKTCVAYLDIKVVDFLKEILDFCFSFSGVKEQKFDVTSSHEYGHILLVDLKQGKENNVRYIH